MKMRLTPSEGEGEKDNYLMKKNLVNTLTMFESTGLDITSKDHHMNTADNNDIISLSRDSIADDIAKGNTVKHQLSKTI